MAGIKCEVCGAIYSKSLRSCPQCEFYRNREHARFESCTGVRYPCSCRCRSCFFENIYGYIKAEKEGSGLTWDIR